MCLKYRNAKDTKYVARTSVGGGRRIVTYEMLSATMVLDGSGCSYSATMTLDWSNCLFFFSATVNDTRWLLSEVIEFPPLWSVRNAKITCFRITRGDPASVKNRSSVIVAQSVSYVPDAKF